MTDKRGISNLSGLAEDILAYKGEPIKERHLYEPVARFLKKEFQRFGSCEIYDTSRSIVDEVKEALEFESLLYVRIDRKNPDLMGVFEPKQGIMTPPFIGKGLIITEVKFEPLKFEHIYQAKMYSEIFSSVNTFLLSGKPITYELTE